MLRQWEVALLWSTCAIHVAATFSWALTVVRLRRTRSLRLHCCRGGSSNKYNSSRGKGRRGHGRVSFTTVWVVTNGVSTMIGSVFFALVARLYGNVDGDPLLDSGPLVQAIWLLSCVGFTSSNINSASVVISAQRGNKARSAFQGAEVATAKIEADAWRLFVVLTSIRVVCTVLALAGVLEGVGVVFLVNYALMTPFMAHGPINFYLHEWPLRHKASLLPPEKAELLLHTLVSRRRVSIQSMVLTVLMVVGAATASLSSTSVAVVTFLVHALWTSVGVAIGSALVRRAKRRASQSYHTSRSAAVSSRFTSTRFKTQVHSTVADTAPANRPPASPS